MFDCDVVGLFSDLDTIPGQFWWTHGPKGSSVFSELLSDGFLLQGGFSEDFLLRTKHKPREFYSILLIFHHPAACGVRMITASDQ